MLKSTAEAITAAGVTQHISTRISIEVNHYSRIMRTYIFIEELAKISLVRKHYSKLKRNTYQSRPQSVIRAAMTISYLQ